LIEEEENEVAIEDDNEAAVDDDKVAVKN